MINNYNRRKKIFQEKTALITGAASGIGRATALELAALGADLIITDIHEPRLRNVQDEIHTLGRNCKTILADISVKNSVASLAQEALASSEKIDILFNNAGIMSLGEVHKLTLEDWERMVDINMWGPVRLTHALLPHFIKNRSGHIITTSSIAGLVATPGMVPYSLTKSGIVGFSESMRSELKGHGIRVSVVCPGPVFTNLSETGIYGSNAARAFASAGKFMASILTPEKAARIIVQGIRKNKAHIVLPFWAKLYWYLKRCSSRLMDKITTLTWQWYGKREGLIEQIPLGK